MSRLWRYLTQHWFLVGLAVVIAFGMRAGATWNADDIDAVLSRISPPVMTFAILLLMAYTLDSRQLGKAFRYPAPVLLAISINFGVLPLLAWPLVSLQGSPDLGVGLMIAASVPCTLAAASVWTRQAKGNDAVSLLVTLLTNGACFAVTPFWMRLATRQEIELDPGQMMLRLALSVLLPTVIGQTLRMLPGSSVFATKRKRQISNVAMCLILVLVFYAAANAGRTVAGEMDRLPYGGLLIVLLTTVGLHVVAMTIGWFASGRLGMSLPDRSAVAIAGSQKTLPIGAYIATDPMMFGRPELPLVVFPMLIYHASQLFIDTFVAQGMARLAAKAASEPAANE